MAYEKPQLSFNQIDKAASRLFDERRTSEEFSDVVRAILNWRAAHSYPLNALHMTLRNRARRLDPVALTVQRLKRFESILRKLNRRSTMQISQMQDIGGCRAVMSNLNRLKMLRFLYESSPLRHELSRTRDYIESPKDDGYRSIHMMYRFRGKATSLPWDRLRVEIQLRTKLQHAWATAVETVDAFTGEDLKFGKGSQPWRRFFALMGSVHALSEKTAPVPGTPESEAGLFPEVQALQGELHVIDRLESYAHITSQITGQRGEERDWYLIQLMPVLGRVTIRGYPLHQFSRAKEELARAEEQFHNTRNQAVLVAAASVYELKKAYPNFFADTTYFISLLRKFLKR